MKFDVSKFAHLIGCLTIMEWGGGFESEYLECSSKSILDLIKSRMVANLVHIEMAKGEIEDIAIFLNEYLDVHGDYGSVGGLWICEFHDNFKPYLVDIL